MERELSIGDTRLIRGTKLHLHLNPKEVLDVIQVECEATSDRLKYYING